MTFWQWLAGDGDMLLSVSSARIRVV